MKAHKYFDGMADQNKLFLGIPVNCMVCGLLCVKKDRLFVNPDDGQIIHYDCFVSALNYKNGLNLDLKQEIISYYKKLKKEI